MNIISLFITLLCSLSLIVGAQENNYGSFGSDDVLKKMVKKSKWIDTNDPPDLLEKLKARPMGAPKYLTIHHTQGSGDSEVSYLRNIRSDVHMKKPGLYEMGDIAYHFLIGPSGTIYEGRDLRYATDSGTRYYTEAIWRAQNIRLSTDRKNGKHVGEVEWVSSLRLTAAKVPERPGAVEGHITICFIGDYFEAKPNQKMQNAFMFLAGYLCKKYKISTDRIWMHREITNSGCPGDNIYTVMRVPPKHKNDHAYEKGPWLAGLSKRLGEK